MRLIVISFIGSMPLVSAAALAADNPRLPDPGSIEVPDISTSDPKVISNGYKFFVFHNPSVDFETAYSDIAECRSFLPAGMGRALPGFTPWIAAPKPDERVAQFPHQYGLIGAGIESIVAPKMQRGQDATISRRCLELRGYVRYAVTEAIWDTLNDPKNALAVAMQAKVAIGPKPSQPEIIDQ
ncbi:hypothetical protein [Rhizorhabdus sp. FW153]|uniref:hypothetical protein n=1 Tax=Rhizorhabdus sp. FW153 TaxID=3400216 RepID=UPI003CE68BDB